MTPVRIIAAAWLALALGGCARTVPCAPADTRLVDQPAATSAQPAAATSAHPGDRWRHSGDMESEYSGVWYGMIGPPFE